MGQLIALLLTRCLEKLRERRILAVVFGARTDDLGSKRTGVSSITETSALVAYGVPPYHPANRREESGGCSDGNHKGTKTAALVPLR
jgi:hypothetical protein